jgi:hypothetical protein
VKRERRGWDAVTTSFSWNAFNTSVYIVGFIVIKFVIYTGSR